jgi:outer membrane protein
VPDRLRPTGQVSVTGSRVDGGRRVALGAFLSTSIMVLAGPASAETLESAMARAYVGNPSLNAQRASTRATDENVPRALSGYRPRVNATADVGAQYTETETPARPNRAAGTVTPHQTTVTRTAPRGVGVTVDQTLFNGFRTYNSVQQAESLVLGSRETLRSTEQDVLFNGVTAYMDVLRDTANLNLQRNNVEVLEEQLRQTRDRFNVGEVTRTDVAQAESRLALGRSQVSAAESNLRASIARFRQVVGVEPRSLAPGRPLDRLVPRNLEDAIYTGLHEHPSIHAALHALDAAELQVKITEGELYPSVGVRGSAAQRYDNTLPGDERFSASVVATLNVPIYEGGEVYARVRQAKETAGQRRIEADVARDLVRANVVTAWGQLEAAKAQIIASQAQVQAAETALTGVREEARVGQRTTLDVLNAQQELLVARVNLITAQRDRVVFSYAVVRAMGRLTTKALSLNVAQYSAKQHFDQVKDLWYGVRTPDGR